MRLISIAMLTGLLVALPRLALAADDQPGKLSIETPWARATPGGVDIGAAYLVIKPGSDAGDKLISASSPAAARVELHTHVNENGVMRMRRVEALELTASHAHKLAPGGDHLMLFDLKAPLKEGDKLPLSLTFEKAGVITFEAPVLGVGAMGPGGETEVTGQGDKGRAADDGSHAGSDRGSHDGSHEGHE